MVIGGFQDPKFRRQSLKTKSRQQLKKGGQEKESQGMINLVNFDQKVDSNNTGSFDEDEEHDKAFEMIRKRSKTYVPKNYI